jgi:peptidoglycan/LPS O-acetylase OafA/YrhL
LGVLRTILAIAVVVYHSFKIFGLRMCGGQVAVESFYMISGFYMALILNEKYIGLSNYKRFIASRFVRIFPVYWFVLICALLLCIVGFYGFNKPFYLWRFISNYGCLSGVAIFYFIFENIFVVGQDVLYFLVIDDSCKLSLSHHAFSFKHTGYQYLLVPQAWSISLEFMFYLIAPFLVTKKIKWQLLIVGIGISTKLFFGYKYYLYYDPWSYRFFPFEIAFFMAGSLAYRYYCHIKQKSISNYIAYSLLFLNCLWLFIFGEIKGNETLKLVFFYTFLLSSMPFIFKTFKDNKWDRNIGELSFSIYIGHHLLVSLFHSYFFSNPLQLKYYGYVIVGLSIVLALILHQILVKPLERYRAEKFS